MHFAAYVTETSMFGSSFINMPRFGGERHFESVNVMLCYRSHARKTKTVQWNYTGVQDAVVCHEQTWNFLPVEFRTKRPRYGAGGAVSQSALPKFQGNEHILSFSTLILLFLEGRICTQYNVLSLIKKRLIPRLLLGANFRNSKRI